MDIMLHLTFVPWLIIIPFHIDSNVVILVCNIKFVWHSNSFMQMASSEHTACRIPFKDISNTTNIVSGPTTSNLQPDVTDPKESKRQRARDAYANMSQDRKEKLLKNVEKIIIEGKHKLLLQMKSHNQQPQSLLQVTLLASFQLYCTTPVDVNLVYKHPK